MAVLKKVQPGDAFAMSADTFNTFVDTANKVRSMKDGHVGALAPPMVDQSGEIVLVKNSSGAAVGRFGILGINGPVFSPADNENEFKKRVVLDGVAPLLADHLGRFVITCEPLAEGKIGRAKVTGVTPVTINIVNVDHEYADIEDGNTSRLISGSGSAYILWPRGGSTGEQLAVVRFGGGASFDFTLCRVTVDGGSAGGESGTCNLTYTVTDYSSALIFATQESPMRPRMSYVEYNSPSANSFGVWSTRLERLVYAIDEIPNTTACET